jgi:hypothetical protein|tara:strand:- start:206 stop:643 length:438 start_codon:yes stop_codon:yes gene_type:complete
MAYFIFSGNDLVSIAANDSDKNCLPLVDSYVVKDVSDSDFEKVRKQTSQTHLEDGNVVIEDSTQTASRFENENDLRTYHENVIAKINVFLSVPSNSSKSIYSSIENYKTYLEGFDYSSITLPTTKTWEEHCEDNSITYISPLQIP